MKNIAIIAVAMMIVGCAVSEKAIRISNPRIVYRDLTKPVTYKIPTPAIEPEPATGNTDQVRQGSQPQFFVEFANESYKKFDRTGLAGLTGHAQKDDLILIVGHSHGNSAVGTLVLASKRAETIKGYLEGRGYQKSLIMASWGGRISNYAPNRGVHVYVIKSAEKNSGIPIIIAKEVKPAPKTTDFEVARNQTALPREADRGGV